MSYIQVPTSIMPIYNHNRKLDKVKAEVITVQGFIRKDTHPYFLTTLRMSKLNIQFL